MFCYVIASTQLYLTYRLISQSMSQYRKTFFPTIHIVFIVSENNPHHFILPLCSSSPSLPSVLLFPAPVFGWQLLGAVVRQFRVFVCQHWSHCSRCMCVCSPTRLHVLVPIEARLADCIVCVCVCVGRQGKTDKLNFCQQLLMNEEVSLVSKEARPTIRADYYKPLTLYTMLSTHLSLLNPFT